ncbi:MAG TPA: rod shape-determining protein MreD [Actinomycetota bacterium]|nr:rod shape-determining protein MreD [Actinomycetota bacterium]
MKRGLVLFLACFTAILASSELAFTLPIRGIGPDLLIVVVATYASREEPQTAAIAGFAAGFLRDLLLTSPAGLSALAYALTAYAAAIMGAGRGVWTYVALVGGATLASQSLHGLGTILLGQDADLLPLPRVVFLTTAYNVLLAPLLMPLLRKITLVERSPAVAGD